MKRNLLGLGLLAALALALGALVVACEVDDEDCACADGTECSEAGEECDDGSSCVCEAAEGEGEGEGEGWEGEGEGEGEPPAWRWVRVCSKTDAVPDAKYPGPDLDAVRVCDSNGANCMFASEIGDKNIEGGQNSFTNPDKAKGAPDTDSVTGDGANFVSIGRTGHYLVLGFERDFLPGAKITVYEIGKSPMFPSSNSNEPSRISVSVQSVNSGTWIQAGEGTGTGNMSDPSNTGQFDVTAPNFDGPEDNLCK